VSNTHISMHLLKMWMGKGMSVGNGNVLERTAKFNQGEKHCFLKTAQNY